MAKKEEPKKEEKEDAKDEKEVKGGKGGKDKEPAEGEEGAAEGEGAAPAKKSPLAFLDPILAKLPPKLKMPILIGVPVVLVLLIVLGLVLGGAFAPKPVAKIADATMTEGGDDTAPTDPNAKPIYYNMPDMLVNLDSRGRKQSILKMSVTLELSSADDLKSIEDRVPRVLDEFQVFLREIRIEDLRGSAGIYRLRQELLARVKPAVAPIKVKDVLFKELLVQ